MRFIQPPADPPARGRRPLPACDRIARAVPGLARAANMRSASACAPTCAASTMAMYWLRLIPARAAWVEVITFGSSVGRSGNVVMGAISGSIYPMFLMMETAMIDWSQCPDVERIPGKVSGAWLVVGTRIPADAVLDNAEDGYTAEQIVAEIYPSLPLDRAKRILAYARERANAPHPA